eukprot:6190206-Pleurochrysis_carterae.AAC.4
MKDGLRDLSISRTTFGWGVAVPEAETTAATHDADAPKHIMCARAPRQRHAVQSRTCSSACRRFPLSVDRKRGRGAEV